MAAARKPEESGVKVDGIALDVTLSRVQDIEVMECLADIGDESQGERVKLPAIIRLYRLVFGDQYDEVKSHIRRVNGGRCNVGDMEQFLGKVFEALDAKN